MKALSLFANVGIAETYLSEIGLDVVVANEIEEDMSYQKLYSDYMAGKIDIFELLIPGGI